MNDAKQPPTWQCINQSFELASNLHSLVVVLSVLLVPVVMAYALFVLPAQTMMRAVFKYGLRR